MSTYIDSCKNPKLKIGDTVAISKHKNIFPKDYVPNWTQEVFVIEKVKNTVPWIYVINDLSGKVIVGRIYENELQKKKQKKHQIQKRV